MGSFLAVRSLEREKIAPTTPAATHAVIASHLTYLTRIAGLLSILIGMIADRNFREPHLRRPGFVREHAYTLVRTSCTAMIRIKSFWSTK